MGTPSEDLSGIRSRVAARVAALRNDLADLENALRGVKPGIAPTTPTQGLFLPSSLLERTLSVPALSRTATLEGILSHLALYGVKDRPFDVIEPVTVPQPINQVGNVYDAGQIFDAWILNPSIDTKFSFTKMPSQNTPFITANSRMQVQVRAEKIWYLAQNAGQEGVLQLWLLRWQD
jgi:hypothetical protein